jgi:hypothetical protein
MSQQPERLVVVVWQGREITKPQQPCHRGQTVRLVCLSGVTYVTAARAVSRGCVAGARDH